MNTEKLLRELCKKVGSYETLEWLDEYTELDMCSYRKDKPPHGEVLTKETGPWLSIIANIAFEGTTMDPSTDRASGDPYSALVRYDWIGHTASLPKKKNVITDDLNKWAIYKSWYSREFTALGSRGVHRGTWVTGMDEDGTVHLRDAEGWFLDEAPESKTTERTIKLDLPSK